MSYGPSTWLVSSSPIRRTGRDGGSTGEKQTEIPLSMPIGPCFHRSGMHLLMKEGPWPVGRQWVNAWQRDSSHLQLLHLLDLGDSLFYSLFTWVSLSYLSVGTRIPPFKPIKERHKMWILQITPRNDSPDKKIRRDTHVKSTISKIIRLNLWFHLQPDRDDIVIGWAPYRSYDGNSLHFLISVAYRLILRLTFTSIRPIRPPLARPTGNGTD